MEKAIGALFVGQYYGSKILRIIHSRKTIVRVEKFLGCSIDDLVPKHGKYIHRSVAWSFITSVQEYWDVVIRKVRVDPQERRRVV